jgi:hypothetical protein
MAILRPTSDLNQGGGANALLLHGGASNHAVLGDSLDTTWAFMGGASTTYGAGMGTGTIDHTVPATTIWVNVRMRRIAVPDTGFTGTTHLNISVVADDQSEPGSVANFNLVNLLNGEASGGAFKWYNAQFASTWGAPGSNTANQIRVLFVADTANACELDIAEISIGDKETDSVDYPQAGGASVTMTGALLPGSDISAPGAPPRSGRAQLNNYFFLPQGFVPGVSDGGTHVQGMGVSPISENKSKPLPPSRRLPDAPPPPNEAPALPPPAITQAPPPSGERYHGKHRK